MEFLSIVSMRPFGSRLLRSVRGWLGVVRAAEVNRGLFRRSSIWRFMITEINLWNQDRQATWPEREGGERGKKKIARESASAGCSFW